MTLIDTLAALSQREIGLARRDQSSVVARAGIADDDVEAAELLVRLFAEAPMGARRGSGEPVRLPEALSGIAQEDASIDLRMQQLLRAPRADLYRHLRWAVARVAQDTRSPIDWHDVYDAVRRWDESSLAVRYEWAGGHWSQPRPRGRPARDVPRRATGQRWEPETAEAAVQLAALLSAEDGETVSVTAATERAVHEALERAQRRHYLRGRTVLVLRDAEQYARARRLAMDLIDVASVVQLPSAPEPPAT